MLGGDYNSPEYQQLQSALYDMKLRWPLYSAWDTYKKSLNWNGNDFRYALIDGNGHVIHEGTQIPSSTELKDVIKEKGIQTVKEQAEEFLKTSPDHIEALVAYGTENITENILEAISTPQETNGDETELDSTQDEVIWGKIAGAWTKILSHEYALNALHTFPGFFAKNIKFRSPTMKSLSRRFLPKIEGALHNSPSSNSLWNLWLFWRKAGDNEMDFEIVLNSVQPSPVALKGSVPPAFVFETYYIECKENNRWPQIIKLLKDVWNREISRQILENNTVEKNSVKPTLLFPQLGDNVGIPLIEALLHTSNRQEADEVFNA
jgi:hypothetical protein